MGKITKPNKAIISEVLTAVANTFEFNSLRQFYGTIENIKYPYMLKHKQNANKRIDANEYQPRNYWSIQKWLEHNEVIEYFQPNGCTTGVAVNQSKASELLKLVNSGKADWTFPGSAY